MKNFTSSTSFKTILIEFFSIVIGVLLALGLNQWREAANNEDRAEDDRVVEDFRETFIMLNQIEKELLNSYQETITIIENRDE